VRESQRGMISLSDLFNAPDIARLAQLLKHPEHSLPRGEQLPLGQRDPNAAPVLSFAQERLWLVSQFDQAATYNVRLAFKLHGNLDLTVLESAIAALARRHESLRVRFEKVDGKPCLIIDDAAIIAMQFRDLSELSEDVVKEVAQAATDVPFDLAVGPLARVSVFRQSADEHLLVISIHHIVIDGLSLELVQHELGVLYAALREGREPDLPTLAIQYSDYAAWQRQWLTGEVLERQLAYWKHKLAGIPAILELPTDRARPHIPSFKGGYATFRIPQDIYCKLQNLCLEEEATLFMALLAAFKVLLSRWSGQKDIVVGSPFSGRTHSKVECLVGFFVNSMVLRTDISGQLSFRELLGRVKKTVMEAYSHQDIPFEKLVAELMPVRDLSRHPLFQVMFALQNMQKITLTIPEIYIIPYKLNDTSAKFDLSIEVFETDHGLFGKMQYAIDLFDTVTMDRLGSSFETLVGAIVSQPDALVHSLKMLSQAQLQELLMEWNGA